MEFALLFPGGQGVCVSGALDVQLRMKKTCPWPFLRPFEIAVCVCVCGCVSYLEKHAGFPSTSFCRSPTSVVLSANPREGVVVFSTLSGSYIFRFGAGGPFATRRARTAFGRPLGNQFPGRGLQPARFVSKERGE